MLLGAGRAFSRDGRTAEVFPLAPAVVIDESLHATPFGDFPFKPYKVDGLE